MANLSNRQAEESPILTTNFIETVNETNKEKLEPDALISNYWFLALSAIAMIGNMTMVLGILLNPRFRKPVNLLVANLFFSSFLFIVSSNLRLLENSKDLWAYNTFVCQLLAVIHRVPIPVIALTTMWISIDRGRIARNPLLSSNAFSPKWRIFGIWAFSIILLLPLSLTRKFDSHNPTSHKCSKIVMLNNSFLSLMYGIIYLLAVHLLPAVILVYETSKTVKKMKFLKHSGVVAQTFTTLPDNRLRLLRNSCIFCLIFLLVWTPFGFFQWAVDLPPDLVPELLQVYLQLYFKCFRNVSYSLIAVNPVILFLLCYDWVKCISSFYRHCHIF